IPKDPELDKDNTGDCCKMLDDCCLLIGPGPDDQVISYYHFFRNVVVDSDNTDPVITVDACGLKNFIVQNDESVMDVNGPIYPFGTRPDIANFDINHVPGSPPPLIGPAFYIGSE